MARARAGGAGPELAAQGPLFDPDRELSGSIPPAGDYRCRVFELGRRAAARRDFYVTHSFYSCRVDDQGDVAGFHINVGLQRPSGLIFRDAGGRGVFLGTLMLGDETRPMDYGRDRTRDMAGFVDRVGERRWRIALPLPPFGAMFNVIELVPVT